MTNLRDLHRSKKARFDKVKEEIKKSNPNMLLHEVEDMAYDCLDGFDDPYVNKLEKVNLFSIAEAVRDNYKWLIQEKYDFWNKDLGWSYSQPYHELVFIKMQDNIILELNEYDINNVLHLLSSLLNDSIKVKEIYVGDNFNHLGGYYEWKRVEVYLDGNIDKIIEFANKSQ